MTLTTTTMTTSMTILMSSKEAFLQFGFHSVLQNCSCPEDCTTLSCLCARNSLRCWYDREGRLTKDFNYTEPPLIFECNRGCRCWKTCSNRVVQHGQSARIQIYKTKGRGWGVRASLDILQGSFIWYDLFEPCNYCKTSGLL